MDETLVPAADGAAGDTAPPRIEGFAFVRPVGHGAMGVVWEAVQNATHRRVAVKVLAGHRMDPEGTARFRREIELAAHLEHPGIARVYDGGVSHGQPFYAMEFVEGLPLDRFADHAGLDRRQRIELMASTCLAVHYAHQRGIIHRDLKPSNILVSADGEPHVLDFGLAKLLDAPPDDALSMDGDIMGTPIFMSPEQARGATHDLDVRTDVYSLGVMLYSLVVGLYPHDVSGSNYDILKRVVENEPRPPRALVRSIDAELQTVLLKAVARDRNDRYASAGDLAEDLRRYLRGDPLLARPPSLAYLLRKGLFRHRAAAAVVASVVASLSAMALESYARIRKARDLETAARIEAETHLAAANRNYAAALVEKARQCFREGQNNQGKTLLGRALDVNPSMDRRIAGLLDAMHPDFPRLDLPWLRDPAMGYVQGPLCASDDERFLFYTRNNRILRWNLNDGTHSSVPLELAGLSGGSIWGTTRQAFFKASPTGRFLSFDSPADGALRLLDFERPDEQATVLTLRRAAPAPGLPDVAFRPDETEVVFLEASDDGGTPATLVFHSLAGNGGIERWPLETGPAAGVAFAADGQTVFVGIPGGVDAMDRQSRQPRPGPRPASPDLGPVRFIAHDGASDRLAFYAPDGFLHVYRSTDGHPLAKVPVEPSPFGSAVRFVPGGRVLVYGHEHGRGGFADGDRGTVIERFSFAVGLNQALCPQRGWLIAEGFGVDISALGNLFPEDFPAPSAPTPSPWNMSAVTAADLPPLVQECFENHPPPPGATAAARERSFQCAIGNSPALSAFQDNAGHVAVLDGTSNARMYASRFWMAGLWLEAIPEKGLIIRFAQEGPTALLEIIDAPAAKLTRHPLDGAYRTHARSTDGRWLAVSAGGKIRLFDLDQGTNVGILLEERGGEADLAFEPDTARLRIRRDGILTRHDLDKADGRHYPDYPECARQFGYHVEGIAAHWAAFAPVPARVVGVRRENDHVVFEFDLDDYVQQGDAPLPADLATRIAAGPVFVTGEFNAWNQGDIWNYPAEWQCEQVAPGRHRLRKPLSLFDQQAAWPFKFAVPGLPLEPPVAAANRARAFADDPWSGLHNLVLEIDPP